MLISQVEKRISASRNTIMKQVKTDQNFYYMKSNMVHITEEGLAFLENKYGLRSEVMSDDDIDFYKGQLALLQNQIKVQSKQFEIYQKQLEQQLKLTETYKLQINSETEEKSLLEKEVKKLQQQIEEYKNKTFIQRVFNK